ncbi:MAG: glycosyltransferase 87 family protein [Rhodospirillaceae bacterium]
MARLFFLVLALAGILLFRETTLFDRTHTVQDIEYVHGVHIDAGGTDRWVRSFQFQFDVQTNHDVYANFFQSGSSEDGIRLELQPGGVLRLYQGSFELGQGLFEWTKEDFFRFDIQSHADPEEVSVQIDGVEVLRAPVDLKTLDFSDMALGSGMSRTRYVDGVIKNGSMSVTSKTWPTTWWGLLVLALGFVAGYAVVAYWFTEERFAVLGQTDILGPVSVINLLVIGGFLFSADWFITPIPIFALFLLVLVAIATVCWCYGPPKHHPDRNRVIWWFIIPVFLMMIQLYTLHPALSQVDFDAINTVLAWYMAAVVPLSLAVWPLVITLRPDRFTHRGSAKSQAVMALCALASGAVVYQACLHLDQIWPAVVAMVTIALVRLAIIKNVPRIGVIAFVSGVLFYALSPSIGMTWPLLGGAVVALMVFALIYSGLPRDIYDYWLDYLDRPWSRDEKIATVSFIVLIGFVGMMVSIYWLDIIMELQPPFSVPFNGPINRFGDFFQVTHDWRMVFFTEPRFGMPYFPAAYLLISPLMVFEDPFFEVRIFLTLFIVCVCAISYYYLRTKSVVSSVINVITIVVLSYPFWFEFLTANFQWLCYFLTILGLFFYERKKFVTAALIIGVAAAMKALPGIFLLIFLAHRRYKEAAFAFVSAAIVTILPLVIFPGGLQEGVMPYWTNLRESQDMYASLMIFHPSGLPFSHSLNNALWVTFGHSWPNPIHYAPLYSVFALGMFAFIAYYVVFVERVYWRQLAVLCVADCLLPMTSTDYKLLVFYIPMFALINLQSQVENKRLEVFALVSMSLLMISKHYIYFHDVVHWRLNIPMNAALMAGLLGAIVYSGWKQYGFPRIRFRSQALPNEDLRQY